MRISTLLLKAEPSLRRIWRWLTYEDPWSTCTNCSDRKAKQRMIYDQVHGYFCNENCQNDWDSKRAW